MKLLLTSAGLSNKKITDFFISKLPKNLNKCSFLIVAYVQDEEEQSYVDYSKKELADLGIKDITYFNLKENEFKGSKKYDVIYVCGGNTFSILNRMRITGIIDFIKNSMKDNKTLYFGISAGSIIAGPNIEVASWGSIGDTNDISLKDLTGLNLTNISIFPHFEDYLEGEVDEFRKKVDYPVVELKDDEALFIEGVKNKIIK
ncbi:MAG: Type 1 glutamine amidotransferase-like domain-containing protein [Candidatus Paceibacterota bacterium]|jgi:dipeptidase E